MQPAAPPRPRGQARGQEPAREDAVAPLKRQWLYLIFKEHQPKYGGSVLCREPFAITDELARKFKRSLRRRFVGLTHFQILESIP